MRSASQPQLVSLAPPPQVASALAPSLQAFLVWVLLKCQVLLFAVFQALPPQRASLLMRGCGWYAAAALALAAVWGFSGNAAAALVQPERPASAPAASVGGMAFVAQARAPPFRTASCSLFARSRLCAHRLRAA